MENEIVAPHAKKLFAIFGISILLGILFDYFFYQKLPGIAFPLYMILLVGGAIIVSNGFKNQHKSGWWLILPITFFSIMVAVRDSAGLTGMNMFISFFCLFLLIVTLNGKKLPTLLLKDYFFSFFIVPISFLDKAFQYFAELFKLKTLIKGHKAINQILKGVLMAVPILIVFLALFSSADPIFNSIVRNIFKFNTNTEGILRIILVLGVTFVVSGFLYAAEYGNKQELTIENNASGKKNPMGTIQVGIFLGLINALFFCFILVQLKYLFGGQQNISIEGYTYAEYARKGFFELIWVAIFSYLIMLLSEKVVEKKELGHSFTFKVTSSILIAQVIIIMVAAFLRLGLYEEAYGFTQLRFYSHAFIIWLGAIFLLFVMKIFAMQREAFYTFEIFITSLLSVGIINVMNPDAFIAHQNINRIGRPNVVRLDTEYLRNLSDDAIPEMITLLKSPDASIRYEAAAKLSELKWKRTEKHELYDQWQSWNYARNTATEMLNEANNLLPQPPASYQNDPGFYD